MKFICEKIMKTILLKCCWENRKKKTRGKEGKTKLTVLLCFKNYETKYLIWPLVNLFY